MRTSTKRKPASRKTNADRAQEDSLRRRRTAAASCAAERKELTAQAAAFTETADPSAAARIIALFGKEHGGRFSDNNCMLILMQCPDATDIRTYQQWQEAGRQVRKGAAEHRIRLWRFNGCAGDKPEDEAIAAASEESGEEESGGKPRFRLYSAFDIAQTDPIQTGAATAGQES